MVIIYYLLFCYFFNDFEQYERCCFRVVQLLLFDKLIVISKYC